MNLADLLVHQQTHAVLRQLAAHPPHAVLLHGTEGLGKTLLARQLAAELTGQPPEKLDGYAYFRFVSPEGGLTLTVEQIRTLQTFLVLKVPGRQTISRVVLIDDAHTMNVQAQNALLKTLEEPPAGTVLLLVSSHPERLLDTVRSRLTTVAVHMPAESQIIAYFTEQGHSEAATRRALLMSSGSLAKLQAILTESEAGPSVFDNVKQLLAATTFERLCMVEPIAKDKTAAREFVAALQQLADASARRAAETGTATLAKWYGILRAAAQAEEALGKNGNAKLVLTDLVLAL